MTATVVEEKQLLLLTMAASQATEVRAVTTEKRNSLLAVQGVANAGG